MKLSVLLLLALAAAEARADCDRDSDCKGGRVCVANKCVERKYCTRDKDCPGDEVCDRNSCVSGRGTAAPPAATGGTYRSREQEAARNAGMALLYTKNTWPVAIVDRPLMVAPGMTEVELDVDRDFSADSATTKHPLTSELFARFGVSDRIHAVLDSVSVCFTDCDPIGFFQFISGYLGYALVANHDMNLVTQFGVGLFNGLDSQNPTASAMEFSALPSVLFGWRLNGSLQLFASAVALIGVTGRDNAFFPDAVSVRFSPRIQITPQIVFAPFIGYVARISHADFYSVPLGAALVVTPDRAVDVGVSFQFPDAFSHTAQYEAGAPTTNVGGTDSRSATVFVTFRL
ncbi:MAG: hypothetical protein ABR567_02250 [Myxococcales bacterium]|nr:hypothetical protein [Myxococcales bacterium]